MWKIQFGFADLMTLDPGDVYVGGYFYNLVPIAAEYYGDETAFYVVAVAWKSNKKLTLNNMKLSQVCSSGAQVNLLVVE